MQLLITAAAALLLTAALLASPAHVAGFVALQWRIGNVTPLVQAARVLLGLAGVLLLVGRRPLAASLRRLATREAAVSAAVVVASLCFALLVAELALRWAHYPFSDSWIPPETALGRF